MAAAWDLFCEIVERYGPIFDAIENDHIKKIMNSSLPSPRCVGGGHESATNDSEDVSTPLLDEILKLSLANYRSADDEALSEHSNTDSDHFDESDGEIMNRTNSRDSPPVDDCDHVATSRGPDDVAVGDVGEKGEVVGEGDEGHVWGQYPIHFPRRCLCRTPVVVFFLNRLLKCIVDVPEQKEFNQILSKPHFKLKKLTRIPTKVSVASPALAALAYVSVEYFSTFWYYMMCTLDISDTIPSTPSASLLGMIVEFYSQQNDPLLRGNCALLCGHVIFAILTSSAPLPQSNANINNLPASPPPTEFIPYLSQFILHALEDCSATTSKLAIRSLNRFISVLLGSAHGPSIVLPAIRSLLLFPSSTYWVVKKEVLSVLSSLDFELIRYWQSSQPQIIRHSNFDMSSYQRDIQEDVLSFVLSHLIDADHRVRIAACECLCEMIPRMSCHAQVCKTCI
jgi:hypothetical protein